MESAGFVRGLSSPSVSYNPVRNLRAVIHGDDFTLLGYDNDLNTLRNRITAKWQVKVKGRIGPSPGDQKEMHVLN